MTGNSYLLHVSVPGPPRGQGSLTLWRAPDGSERAKHPPHTVAHRNLMVGLLQQAWGLQGPWLGPVVLDSTFYMPRPQSHFRTGKYAGEIKPTAPAYPVTFGRNDADKMIRLVGDALTIAGVIKDDAQIVRVLAVKQWEPGAGNGHTTVILEKED